jgi:anti-sigma regulatory factor (Ser/Thr protein kinase)
VNVRALEPASLRLRLQAQPEFAAAVRTNLRVWLEGLGARDDDVSEIVIAASEAFANAVEHPRAPTRDAVEVEASLVAEWVTVRVRDYGSWQHERLRPGGNGFLLMWQLMDSVEVDCRRTGTVVAMRRQLSA